MSVYQARKWLVVASLGVAAASFTFFILAPVFGYPLRYSQSQTILQIIFPVFLGYLGAATQFAFQKAPPAVRTITARPMMELLVKGPVIVFCIMVIVSVIAFGYSNRASSLPGEGMSVDVLATTVTAALGLLAVTTNAIVSYLFSVEERASGGA
jgi:hypothetical protein